MPPRLAAGSDEAAYSLRMRFHMLAVSGFVLSQMESIQGWMDVAFYPALLLILVLASLGVPIPEDLPLIAAGVVLRTTDGVATWHWTIIVALIGIMSGDLVLYSLGRRWGPDLLSHRSVRWLLTPERYAALREKFHYHGMWLCFVGRFFMGIRAAMCLTAGATRFPYWRFFLADFAGAVLSVPFFILLGYYFAGMIPQLRQYIAGAEGVLLAAAALVLLVLTLVYRARKRRRAARAARGGVSRHSPGAASAPAPADLTAARPAGAACPTQCPRATQ